MNMKPVLIASTLLLASCCLSVSAAVPATPAGAVPAKTDTSAAKATPTTESSAPKMDAAAAEKQLEAIEKQYFQHTFLSDTVDHRLTRIEKFTFGETYSGSTISRLQRLAATLSTSSSQLEDTEDAPRKTASKPVQSRSAGSQFAPGGAAQKRTPQSGVPQTTAPSASDSGEDYPHVTFLENQILKQTFEGEPVEQRLARLETKAFGSPSQNPDLSARTDALERYSENRLHKRSFAMDPEPEDNPNFPVGYSTLPAGFPPAEPSKFDLAKEERKAEEDKAAVDPTPPNEHDRLLSRVAWCEQHTFGRTFPDMHLLQRLHQLNAHLFPKDKEKDVQLMDRMDLIVKTVVLQQHPPQQATQ